MQNSFYMKKKVKVYSYLKFYLTLEIFIIINLIYLHFACNVIFITDEKKIFNDNYLIN